ncbi:MAG TPA: hypothetical protein VM243_04580 [Phycisphaerae bacterium]|nr:hypothetical protein [Phycisphaerae bacterium]
MTPAEYPLDLVVLVPGKDEQAAINSLLSSRQQSLGIRCVDWRILVHPRRDPGCRLQASEVLEPFVRYAWHALTLFDHAGCGREDASTEEIETDVKDRLSRAGWGDRADVIVIAPELESWVWSDSPELDEVLGWQGRQPPLRDWLRDQGLWAVDRPKPADPKNALVKALREVRILRSAAIYGKLARTVGLRRCRDDAFSRLRGTLRAWFGREEGDNSATCPDRIDSQDADPADSGAT